MESKRKSLDSIFLFYKATAKRSGRCWHWRLLYFGRRGRWLAVKFCHIFPVALWHETHPTFRIMALLDFHRIIKGLPKPAINSLFSIRSWQLKFLERYDHPPMRLIHKRHFMRFVVNQKMFLGITFPKVLLQKRQDVIFRFRSSRRGYAGYQKNE